jgi:hypothetical protein
VATKQPAYEIPKQIPVFQSQMMDTKRLLKEILFVKLYLIAAIDSSWQIG